MRNVVLVSAAALSGNVVLHRGAAVTPVRNVVLVRAAVQQDTVVVVNAYHQLVYAATVKNVYLERCVVLTLQLVMAHVVQKMTLVVLMERVLGQVTDVAGMLPAVQVRNVVVMVPVPHLVCVVSSGW